MATVPDDDAHRSLAAGMTLEAWVRPQAATDWRNVLFKESAGGVDYALYANSDNDTPSANLGGDPGARGSSDLDPDKWSHLAATYDGTTLQAVRERHRRWARGRCRTRSATARAARSPSAPTTSGASTSTGSSTRSGSTTAR